MRAATLLFDGGMSRLSHDMYSFELGKERGR